MLLPNAHLLTRNGWKNVTELSAGEDIMTTNFAGHGIFLPITTMSEYNYSGNVYEFERGFADSSPKEKSSMIAFSVTEGSRIPSKKSRSKTPRVFTVEDIAADGGIYAATIVSPLIYGDSKMITRKIYDSRIARSDYDYFRLLALLTRRGYVEGSIKMSNDDQINLAAEILDAMGIRYTVRLQVNERDVRFILLGGKQLSRAVAGLVKSGGPTGQKSIPAIVTQSKSPEAIYGFLVTSMRLTNKRFAHYETLPDKGEYIEMSFRNEEDAIKMLDLFYLVGYVGSYKTRPRDDGTHRYIVGATKASSRVFYGDKITTRHYSGKVYSIDHINEYAPVNVMTAGYRGSMVVSTL